MKLSYLLFDVVLHHEAVSFGRFKKAKRYNVCRFAQPCCGLRSPLNCAVEHGNIELVRFLRQKYVARWYAEVLREHNARFRLKDN